MNLRRLSASYIILGACLGLPGELAIGSGNFSQLVVSFPDQRTYAYRYNKSENALVIEFAKTSPEELRALDFYDERLIRRVLVKHMGPPGTEVKLILRDRNVRAHVGHFDEPFRVVIDLFEANFEETRDPTTGMPLVNSHRQDSPAAADSSLQTVAPFPSADRADIAQGLVTPLPSEGVSAEAPGATGERKLRLLQPAPEILSEPDEFSAAIRKTPAGLGKAWASFPPYVYRIKAGLLDTESAAPPDAANAVSSVEALASYAGKLYDFGHEGRALVAYQQVLHRDQNVFEKDALHLWKFAEVNLGQGNLTLARGYYSALVAKHPESAVAQFAKLRILDINSLRMIQTGRAEELPSLASGLKSIQQRDSGELAAQVALRKAYWSDNKTPIADEGAIPNIQGAIYNELAAVYPTVEWRRTRFLAANILLNKMLDNAWRASTGQFADNYFKEFNDKLARPYREKLRLKLYKTLNRSMQKKVAEGQLLEAVQDYQSLPQRLKSISNNAVTSWSLAEAYRKLGQTEKAVGLYQKAAKGAKAGSSRFKANFWLAVTSGQVANKLKAQKRNQAQVNRMAKLSREADQVMSASWNELSDNERDQIAISYKEALESTVTSQSKLRTPPKIVLSNWTRALSTRVSGTSASEAPDWQKHFSPSGSAVFLLTDLAKRFSELGMKPERRQALGLLRRMTPKEMAEDRAAKKLWARQLINLAEDYRRANQYLDAGRIYKLVGTESENWEGRAEALYKGGLLLYRAGRREEAIAAFTESSNDGNNLHYAKLAKERLGQLE